ncbi:MAG: hypothetical protein Q4E89_05125 [Eubacteriales bacterium]|nr:hypothetical protein [Eubacteriales bacterium]
MITERRFFFFCEEEYFLQKITLDSIIVIKFIISSKEIHRSMEAIKKKRSRKGALCSLNLGAGIKNYEKRFNDWERTEKYFVFFIAIFIVLFFADTIWYGGFVYNWPIQWC